MVQTRYVKRAFVVLLKVAGGVVALWIVAAAVIGIFSRPNSHWELEWHDRDGVLASTLRESGGSRHRTIVFEGMRLGPPAQRTYRLPGELKKGTEIDGAELMTYDTTRLPGFVRFRFRGHTFDVMERALIIDGIEHLWDAPGVITLKPSNQSMKPTAGSFAINICDA